MSHERSRQWVTATLVSGAVVFGMVLAGSLDLTAPGSGSPQPSAPGAAASLSPASYGLPSFADLAEQVSPAVVSVEAVKIERSRRPRGIDPYEFFFGPRDRRRNPDDEEEPEQEFRSDSGGSGFVISPDGLVVTNYHVIEGATQLRVHLRNRDYAAQVRGSDPATDLALLTIDADRELPYLPLGDSEALRVGDWVMAIGNPLRFENAVTVGVVSGKERQISITPDFSLENFIQTDAAINFGNSGGPLVNLKGEVIGINTAINWGSENIGFAVPVDTLKSILPQLKETGRVTRGYLGIRIRDIDWERAQAWGLATAEGALVESVDPGTPAEEAGLEHGDVILEVDGRKVAETRDLIGYVSTRPPGAVVTLKVVREGKALTKRVELGERPPIDAEGERAEPGSETGIEWLGLGYQDLTPRLRSMHGLPEDAQGVWVTEVAPASPLFDENLRPGDLIAEVNGQPVRTVAEFEGVIGGAPSGSFLRLYVLRYDRQGGSRPAAFFALVRVP